MSSFIDKLKTQLGGYFAKEEDLATVATTGDYSDLINAPQGGGGGSDDKKIYFQIDINTMTQSYPSELNDLASNGKVGSFQSFGLHATNTMFQITTGIFKVDLESNKYLICFDNPYNVTGECTLSILAEVNGQFTLYSIATINIQESQQTYII